MKLRHSDHVYIMKENHNVCIGNSCVHLLLVHDQNTVDNTSVKERTIFFRKSINKHTDHKHYYLFE